MWEQLLRQREQLGRDKEYNKNLSRNFTKDTFIRRNCRDSPHDLSFVVQKLFLFGWDRGNCSKSGIQELKEKIKTSEQGPRRWNALGGLACFCNESARIPVLNH